MTLHLLRTILAGAYPNVEIVAGTATLLPDGAPLALPYSIMFLEMARISADDIAISVI